MEELSNTSLECTHTGDLLFRESQRPRPRDPRLLQQFWGLIDAQQWPEEFIAATEELELEARLQETPEIEVVARRKAEAQALDFLAFFQGKYPDYDHEQYKSVLELDSDEDSILTALLSLYILGRDEAEDVREFKLSNAYDLQLQGGEASLWLIRMLDELVPTSDITAEMSLSEIENWYIKLYGRSCSENITFNEVEGIVVEERQQDVTQALTEAMPGLSAPEQLAGLWTRYGTHRARLKWEQEAGVRYTPEATAYIIKQDSLNVKSLMNRATELLALSGMSFDDPAVNSINARVTVELIQYAYQKFCDEWGDTDMVRRDKE